MGKKFDISIIKSGVDDAMDKMERIGLCMRRFKADIVMDETSFDALKLHDVIEINGRRLAIVQIGKRCFDECQLYSNEAYCPLKHHCAFGMWSE